MTMTTVDESKQPDVIKIVENELKKITESLKKKLDGKEMTEDQWWSFKDVYDEMVFSAIFMTVKETIKRK